MWTNGHPTILWSYYMHKWIIESVLDIYGVNKQIGPQRKIVFHPQMRRKWLFVFLGENVIKAICDTVFVA
jgi:hypothetical protein